MENTSKTTRPISRRDRAYYRRRQQNRIHAALAEFFAEEAAAGRITKKQLADLLEKSPAQITRWLTEPSNYESDTISDLLLGMGAEMDHRIVRFSDRAKQNYLHPLAAKVMGATLKATPEVSSKTAKIKSPTATNSPAEFQLVAAE